MKLIEMQAHGYRTKPKMKPNGKRANVNPHGPSKRALRGANAARLHRMRRRFKKTGRPSQMMLIAGCEMD